MPKSHRMRSRSRSRSRRGGFSMNDLNPFGSSTDTPSSSSSSSGSFWDKITGKKPSTGMDSGYGMNTPSYGASTGMNTGMNYGASTGMNTGMNSPSYGTSSMNSGMNSPSYGASTGMGYSGAGRGKRRRMRGGSVTPNVSLTNLASRAAPVSGVDTVKAQTWVGGRTKRRRHRHTKSCKKSCRKH